MSEKLPIFKFIIIGESGVGKSCLLMRYTKEMFVSDYNITIGVEFSSKIVQVDKRTSVKLQVWDAAGQESFRSIIRSFYRNVSGIFLVYSITRKDSLTSLISWINEARENCQENAITILVGSKSDLEMKREVTVEDGQKFMEQYKLDLFFETSSKENINVDTVKQNYKQSCKAFIEAAKLVFITSLKNSIKSSQKESIIISEVSNKEYNQKKQSWSSQHQSCC